MKIATYTRITLDREKDKRKLNDLMADADWILYEAHNNLVTFEKLSELIIT